MYRRKRTPKSVSSAPLPPRSSKETPQKFAVEYSTAIISSVESTLLPIFRSSSMERRFHEISMAFAAKTSLEISMELRGHLSVERSMELHGVPWASSVEVHGVHPFCSVGHSMELHGVIRNVPWTSSIRGTPSNSIVLLDSPNVIIS